MSFDDFTYKRRVTPTVNIGNILMGYGHDIVIQSMTSTKTSDISTTANQIAQLYKAGSQIVRITVNDHEAAKAVPYIREAVYLLTKVDVPLVGCFHYNGHTLLQEHQECAKGLAKYRINPGNVGFGNKKDSNFDKIIEIAQHNNKPIRIGANWGSLDKYVLAQIMDNNTAGSSSLAIQCEALIQSTINSMERALNLGMTKDKIVLSAKVSSVKELVYVYRKLAKATDCVLHLGLTEAGPGLSGEISTASAFAILLSQGIGDTIRCSITPESDNMRHQEVLVCKEILQSLGLKYFAPKVTACPGCGRTSSTIFQKMAQDINDFIAQNIESWKATYPGCEKLKIAVMGCIVNGPGESKNADIGISLPGDGESPAAPVFIDGQRAHVLRGPNITEEFKMILMNYIVQRYDTN